ncbi:MAG: nucleoside monophosphate kinase [Candidatus Kerfeldbacteria bacterium]|nr:nucleoside monophosphate kinase [Candidatus Kerfeldbacteria bacterium]
MNKQPYIIIILGPQGSGKGTQAEALARRFKLRHIDMGALLRSFAASRHSQARRVQQIMNEGKGLVPTTLVLAILQRALTQIPRSAGILFDGFPRNQVQATALDRILRSSGRTITHAFYLPISTRTTIARLARRGRVDDTPAAITKRLATYRKKTKPVIDHYRRRGVLATVNGEPTIPEVTRAILTRFK